MTDGEIWVSGGGVADVEKAELSGRWQMEEWCGFGGCDKHKQQCATDEMRRRSLHGDVKAVQMIREIRFRTSLLLYWLSRRPPQGRNTGHGIVGASGLQALRLCDATSSHSLRGRDTSKRPFSRDQQSRVSRMNSWSLQFGKGKKLIL